MIFLIRLKSNKKEYSHENLIYTEKNLLKISTQSALEEVLRCGARRMLQEALEEIALECATVNRKKRCYGK